MKKITSLFLILFTSFSFLQAQDQELASPDNNIWIGITTQPFLHYTIKKNGKILLPEVRATMTLKNGKILAKGDKIKGHKVNTVKETITPTVAVKNATIPNHYNELVIKYKNFKVAFRAYNDAVAYRFITNFKDSIIVKSEQFKLQLPNKSTAWFAQLDNKDNVQDRWMNSYEHLYLEKPTNTLGSSTAELPLLVNLHEEGKILITESDLHDYPGLYFTGAKNNSLKSIFPPRVKTNRKNVKGQGGWDRVVHPKTVYPYIAKTSGKRTFPWRIIAIADKDIQLLNNEIVYKLAEPNRLENTDWITPGQVAWDWWNHWNITGVDFKAGINNQTYKYYIDFAARHNLPYIIMDDGWYMLGDLTQESENIDVAELSQYAQSKDVGIILWCSWLTLDKQMKEVMDLFEKWNIKGIKVDFMNRDDQDMVNFYWRCAKAAAEHHLIVDYHGSHKPAGLNRTYPNVINYEGVAGLENDKWTDKMATPTMAVTLPFTRMFAGPMDYTPGAMRNAQKRDFKAIGDYPMSLGTRCQQLAMYVLYDAPLQMLSDNPTIYEKNPKSLQFITSVPTTWDKTIPLAGKIGEYFAMARKKGKQYFVGAMTNWDARDLTIDFSFLPPGDWQIVIFKDGVNADRNGIDFKKTTSTISNKDQLKIHMAPGGGWAARISKP
ncbi:MAG TPA: glycoside hydrolase family 97 protein [Chitinophagaceae bacterium]|nr:glycoside hydrolase family 97 protein [Chitinophagaceae bacterium]